MAHSKGTAHKAVSHGEAAPYAPRPKGFGSNYASRKSAREGASANPLRRGFEPGVAAGAKIDGWDGRLLVEAIGLGFSERGCWG